MIHLTLYRVQDNLAGGSAAAAAGSGAPAASASSSPPVYLTPDAVMAYCQSRLQGIDSQVQAAMTQQQNVNTEQQGIQNILSEVSTLQSQVNDNGVVHDPASAQKLEQDIESLVSQIERTDPSCSQLDQLKQLHDTVMATGTGPYGSNPVHGYYSSSSSTPGMPPNGSSPPSGVRADQDGTFGSDELKGFSDTLSGINNNLNNSAELGMISIQSLMSQRSTAIQLATNIMQSLDDGTSKIAGNIGH
jgi:hypothetical protein